MMSRAVVCLSGGMDSATTLARCLFEGNQVVCAVSFKYGSKHNPYELEAAKSIADYYRVPHRVIDVTCAFKEFRSALMLQDIQVPEGHYEEENMKLTVVPGRNLIFASILTGIAWSLDAESVWMGVHAGDHYIYPDCRPGWFYAMNSAVIQGTDGKVRLEAPFLYQTKVGILRWGIPHYVPYELTRTCYKPQPVACGKCGACQERLEAFSVVGVEDPIDYESRELFAKRA